MGLLILFHLWFTEDCMLWQEPEYAWTDPVFLALYSNLNFG